jgi:hypothetical protein
MTYLYNFLTDAFLPLYRVAHANFCNTSNTSNTGLPPYKLLGDYVIG